jgi:hypothetical protein
MPLPNGRKLYATRFLRRISTLPPKHTAIMPDRKIFRQVFAVRNRCFAKSNRLCEPFTVVGLLIFPLRRFAADQRDFPHPDRCKKFRRPMSVLFSPAATGTCRPHMDLPIALGAPVEWSVPRLLGRSR